MTSPIPARCGTWRSPITAARVAAGTRPLTAPRIAGGRVRWLEGLPEEGGRVAVVERAEDGTRRVLTPAPFNVRSRVHEYGGGAWCTDGATIWFSHFADHGVYEQREGEAPRAVTSDATRRHADFELDATRARLLAVCEDHGAQAGGEREPRNRLVAIDLASGNSTTLAEGDDFYASPRLSPDGRRLAWLSWRHPRMPWEGTSLWLAAIADDGTLAHVRQLAGGDDEAIVEPCWAPDGRLYCVSDRSGWWNLHRVEAQGLVPVLPMAAEFATPHWSFAPSHYGFANEHEIVAAATSEGRSRLLRVDVRDGTTTPIETSYDDITELHVAEGRLVLLAGSGTQPISVVSMPVAATSTQGADVLARSADDVPPATLLALPQAIAYPSARGRTAHAFHYAPHNEAYAPVEGELPPLLVVIHGGPTSMTTTSLRLMIQFWTSRGFAVLDVNYGGSSGYGRAYRQLLSGQWGIVDVEDCVAGARWLAERGLVDGDRLAIRGGSAGGFTTLAALAFHDVFKAGASYYGVGDLRALDADTHKFESRYSEDLLGPPEVRERVYDERSPLLHADAITCPVIFFQGLDDRVVPPAQSQEMADALRARGIATAYHAYEGEGHGFRRKDTVQASLEAELAFYGDVFGFTPATGE